MQVKEEWGLFERTSQDSYAYNLAPHITCNEQQQGGSSAVMHDGLEEKLRQLQVVGKVLAKCLVDQQLSSVRIVLRIVLQHVAHRVAACRSALREPSYTHASSLRAHTLAA